MSDSIFQSQLSPATLVCIATAVRNSFYRGCLPNIAPSPGSLTTARIMQTGGKFAVVPESAVSQPEKAKLDVPPPPKKHLVYCLPDYLGSDEGVETCKVSHARFICAHFPAETL